MRSNISKAFGFLRIKYPEQEKGLSFILYYLPALLSILICSFILIIEFMTVKSINIFTQTAFESISTFVQVLPGFYIAALAAIASYSNPFVDNAMAGSPPYLEEVDNRGTRKSYLSRRRFLTLMFGYLAAISIILTIFLFVVRLGYETKILSVDPIIYYSIYSLLCFMFFAIFSQMVLVTLHGIYYLADRMHLP